MIVRSTYLDSDCGVVALVAKGLGEVRRDLFSVNRDRSPPRCLL